MTTKFSLNVVFPINTENDINKFAFFTQYGQIDEDFIICFHVIPKYPIDGKTVRNINTSFVLDRQLMQSEFFGVLSLLKELENTVNDFTSTAEELNQKYYNIFDDYFHKFGVK